MEIELAKLLKTSNNNLRDGEEYTEAELELIRAMSLKEVILFQFLHNFCNNSFSWHSNKQSFITYICSIFLQAKAKWAQLKKMRALVGYREAKLKRQAKIKSKSLV